MKATEQYFSMILFIMLCKVVLIFAYVRPNERCLVVISYRVYKFLAQ